MVEALDGRERASEQVTGGARALASQPFPNFTQAGDRRKSVVVRTGMGTQEDASFLGAVGQGVRAGTLRKQLEALPVISQDDIDAFAYTSAYSASRALISIVHHVEDGEISRARVGVKQ